MFFENERDETCRMIGHDWGKVVTYCGNRDKDMPESRRTCKRCDMSERVK